MSNTRFSSKMFLFSLIVSYQSNVRKYVYHCISVFEVLWNTSISKSCREYSVTDHFLLDWPEPLWAKQVDFYIKRCFSTIPAMNRFRIALSWAKNKDVNLYYLSKTLCRKLIHKKINIVVQLTSPLSTQ